MAAKRAVTRAGRGWVLALSGRTRSWGVRQLHRGIRTLADPGERPHPRHGEYRFVKNNTTSPNNLLSSPSSGFERRWTTCCAGRPELVRRSASHGRDSSTGTSWQAPFSLELANREDSTKNSIKKQLSWVTASSSPTFIDITSSLILVPESMIYVVAGFFVTHQLPCIANDGTPLSDCGSSPTQHLGLLFGTQPVPLN